MMLSTAFEKESSPPGDPDLRLRTLQAETVPPTDRASKDPTSRFDPEISLRTRLVSLKTTWLCRIHESWSTFWRMLWNGACVCVYVQYVWQINMAGQQTTRKRYGLDSTKWQATITVILLLFMAMVKPDLDENAPPKPDLPHGIIHSLQSATQDKQLVSLYGECLIYPESLKRQEMPPSTKSKHIPEPPEACSRWPSDSTPSSFQTGSKKSLHLCTKDLALATQYHRNILYPISCQ